MKSELNSATPEKQRIVISVIGWLLDLIIHTIRKRKEKKN